MPNVPDISDLLHVPFSKMKCWQLVVQVERRFGLDVPDYHARLVEEKGRHYKDSPVVNDFFLSTGENWVKIDKPEPGCIIAMALDADHPDLVQHFGVCLGRIFVHTTESKNVHTVPMNHRFYSGKMRGFYRWAS